MAELEILSPNFTAANRGVGDIDYIVLHSTENEPGSGVALSVAHYFQGNVSASSHRIFDESNNVLGVRYKDVAWAAPGANRRGLQYELVGRAHWTRDQWLEPRNKATIMNAAKQAAKDLKEYNLPIQLLQANNLQAGGKGITFHHAASDAWHGSDHTDPNNGHGMNDGFPFDVFLDLVRQYSGITNGDDDMVSDDEKRLIFSALDNLNKKVNDLHTGLIQDANSPPGRSFAGSVKETVKAALRETGLIK